MDQVKILYLVAAVIFLLIVYIIFTQKNDNNSEGTAKADNFNDKGWIVFTRPGCSWCHKQMEELKSTPFKYVECAPPGKQPGHHQSGTLIAAPANRPCTGLDGFPTWYNVKSGKTVSGFKTVEQLNALD